jgi:hypothetical protein
MDGRTDGRRNKGIRILSKACKSWIQRACLLARLLARLLTHWLILVCQSVSQSVSHSLTASRVLCAVHLELEGVGVVKVHEHAHEVLRILPVLTQRPAL